MVISRLEQVLREHFDYTDRDTVKAIAEASDAQQNQMLVALTSKLYEYIVAKTAKIDYTTVSSSRGDITKIERYEDLCEIINIIKGIVMEYKCDLSPILAVQDAIDNTKSRANVYKKAFVYGASVPMLLYNNVCMCIVSSVSFLIDTCIEYIKNPESQSFEMALDVIAYNKSKDYIMFESLKTYNEGCKSGDIDAAIELCLVESKKKAKVAEAAENAVVPDSPFMTDDQINGEVETDTKTVIHDDSESSLTEGLVSIIGRGLLVLCKLVIPLIRQLVFLYFFSRQKIADFYETNAMALEANAYQVQYDTSKDQDTRDTIYKKQMRIAEKMRRKAQRASIDYKKAERDAGKEMSSEQRKLTISDVDYNPNADGPEVDTSGSVLF